MRVLLVKKDDIDISNEIKILKENNIEIVDDKPDYIISFGGGVYTKNAYEYNDVIWKDVQKRLMSIVSDLNFEKNLSYLSFEQWCDQLQNRGVYFRLPFSMSFD